MLNRMCGFRVLYVVLTTLCFVACSESDGNGNLNERVRQIEEQLGLRYGEPMLLEQAQMLNIRQVASGAATVLAMAHQGAHLRKLSCVDDECSWYQVEFRVGALPYRGFVAGGECVEEIQAPRDAVPGLLHDSRIVVPWENEVVRELTALNTPIWGFSVRGLEATGHESVLYHILERTRPVGIRLKELELSERDGEKG
jgi:hypothetical protein